MIQYPLRFEVAAESGGKVEQSWVTRVPGHSVGEVRELTAAIPPEFAGPGGGYSPEDFYALALLNCFVATFQVIASKSQLVYSSLSVKGILTVDRNEQGMPWMKHFHLEARIEGARDLERTERLLQKTSQSCLILNSVRTEKSFDFKVIA